MLGTGSAFAIRAPISDSLALRCLAKYLRPQQLKEMTLIVTEDGLSSCFISDQEIIRNIVETRMTGNPMYSKWNEKISERHLYKKTHDPAVYISNGVQVDEILSVPSAVISYAFHVMFSHRLAEYIEVRRPSVVRDLDYVAVNSSLPAMATPAYASGSSSPVYALDERSSKRQRVDTDSVSESKYHSMDESASPGDRTPVRETRSRRSSYDSSEGEGSALARKSLDETDHVFYRQSKHTRRGSSLASCAKKEAEERLRGRFSASSNTSNINYEPSIILKGHRKGVSMVKFSPDGNMIASCCKSR